MARTVHVYHHDGDDRPPISAWPIILTLAVIITFWQWVLAAVAVAVLMGVG